MSTDPDYHRTFMRLEMIPAWGGYCWVNAAGLPYRRAKQNQNEGFKAFQAVGADLNDIYIHPRDDQNFWHYATAWEKTFSTLGGSSSSREAVPVVDERLTVVGHCGRFYGSKIFIRKGAEPIGVGPTGISREFKPGEPVFVRAWRPSPSYVSLLSREFEVFVTPDGAVRRIEGGAVLEGAEPSISPFDLISIARLGLMVGRVTFPSVRGCSLKSIEFKGRPRLQAEGPTEPLAQQAAREAARAAAAQVAGSVVARRVGRVTVEEMERLLTEVLARRPELRRLMAARVMTGEGRIKAIHVAWQEWERSQGWKVVHKAAREMEAVTHPQNLMTLRTQTRELWVNTDRAASRNADTLYTETAHEFSAHALAGRGGTFTGADLPFIGHEFSRTNNALFILENAMTREGGLQRVLRIFRP